MEQEIEIWKDVIGYEKYYQISNFGRFKYKERIILIPNRPNYKRILIEKITFGKIMSTKNRTRFCVSLSLPFEKSKREMVHRIVAIHFLEKIEGKEHVNHIDGNRFNNKSSNLEWVTNMENQHHGQLNKVFKSKHTGVGFQSKNNKWYARIYNNGVRVRIGTFDTELEAFNARTIYANNHGLTSKYAK